jgi:drug/metabolite transporter (DMT)-like permease
MSDSRGGEGHGRRGTPPVVYFYLGVIILSWAANWPMMKLALGDAPPLIFVSLRLIGTVALMVPAMAALRVPLLPASGERMPLFWVGQLQVAGFLLCGIIGLQLVPAGRAVVLAYTMPLWALPIGVFLWREPLSRNQLAGAALGFAGLVMFMNPALVDWRDWRALLGNALLILAAICWALGSCLYRRHLWRTPFWTQTLWQLVVSVPPVIVLALPAEAGQPVHWTPGLVAILAYNWVVTTALGYFLWSKVLTAMSAAVAGQVLALTPVGGYLLSLALFGGTFSVSIAISIALIVGGIVLTLRR